MKTYQIVEPPKAPGLYVLKNKTTGQIYIGRTQSLLARYREWRGVINNGIGATNSLLDQALKTSKPSDWEFGVLLEVTSEEAFLLVSKEAEAIRRAHKSFAGTLLNGIVPLAVTISFGGSVALTKVHDENGIEMTYKEAAARLGVTHQAVKKRLAAWRKKGRTIIQMHQLEK